MRKSARVMWSSDLESQDMARKLLEGSLMAPATLEVVGVGMEEGASGDVTFTTQHGAVLLLSGLGAAVFIGAGVWFATTLPGVLGWGVGAIVGLLGVHLAWMAWRTRVRRRVRLLARERRAVGEEHGERGWEERWSAPFEACTVVRTRGKISTPGSPIDAPVWVAVLGAWPYVVLLKVDSKGAVDAVCERAGAAGIAVVEGKAWVQWWNGGRV